MGVNPGDSVRVAPIVDDDARRVAQFLHANLNTRVSVDHWVQALDVPWAVERPNCGFMLLADDTIVGAQLAFYSDRVVEGSRVRFCNLGAWCVMPAYRFHSLRLLKAALAQEGYHFTDLSPSGNAVVVNARLRFQDLDTTTALIPNLPWPSWPRRHEISSDPELIRRTLSGRELDLYRDHAGTAAAKHSVLIEGDEWSYVIFRKDRRKGLGLFATVLHVSNPSLFRRLARPFARHLLIRHRAAATLIERRIVSYSPRVSVSLRSPRRRMFRSANLQASQIDYLYSELVCVSW